MLTTLYIICGLLTGFLSTRALKYFCPKMGPGTRFLTLLTVVLVAFTIYVEIRT